MSDNGHEPLGRSGRARVLAGHAANTLITPALDRKHPPHLPSLHRPGVPIVVFVTVCARNRQPILANDRVHAALRAAWTEATRYHVGRYVVMPDHLHLFASPEDDAAPPIDKWVAYWKRLVSRNLGETALWQKNCWDTQMRHRRAYEEKWEYVRHNPVRHGLVREAAEWPYQGSLHPLEW